MPAPGRLAFLGKSVRILRFLSVVAIIVAVAAVLSVLKGGSQDRGEALIAAAIFFSVIALLGLGLAAWPYIKKEKNDSRS